MLIKSLRKINTKLQFGTICFCLKLSSRHHIGAKEFKEINWLPTKERTKQRVATKDFKY